jgi:nitrate/TMAO reductase-like tetraheme cytochrome c subunit
MTVTDQRFMFCINCAYSVWPQHELGYCAHPDANESITAECRDALGACGPNAKLYMEMPNEKTRTLT